MISPKPNIARLSRHENAALDRAGYLCLDKNEDIIGFDRKIIDDMLSKVDSHMISAYPMVYKLYEKAAGWLGTQKGSIYVSSGSDGAIKSVFEAYVGKGDGVVILHPTYAMYYVYSDMFEADLKKVRFDDDFSLSSGDIISAISPKTKLVCIANPNSPTGTVIEEGELLKIIDFADKNRTLVLLDEAYYGYYPVTYLEYIERFKNLIVTRSFTKAYGLGSARLGLAVSNPEIISNLKKVRPIYEVNSFAILLGSYVIDHPEIFKEHMVLFREGKECLLKGLARIGMKSFDTYANFVLIKMKDGTEAMALADRLKDRKVLVRAGFTEEPMQGCIRVNVGTKEQMNRFIKALSGVLDSAFACKRGQVR